MGEPRGWGHGVRSVKFIKHFGHQLQVMFWTGYKQHEPVWFSPVHTVAIETLTSVLKLLSESPPTPAYPIITHWETVVSSTKKMELRLPKPREGAMSFPHPSPRQGPPSTPQGLGSVRTDHSPSSLLYWQPLPLCRILSLCI